MHNLYWYFKGNNLGNSNGPALIASLAKEGD
jgi:hypothetical protein